VTRVSNLRCEVRRKRYVYDRMRHAYEAYEACV
jgi:hypothetical protein